MKLNGQILALCAQGAWTLGEFAEAYDEKRQGKGRAVDGAPAANGGNRGMRSALEPRRAPERRRGVR